MRIGWQSVVDAYGSTLMHNPGESASSYTAAVEPRELTAAKPSMSVEFRDLRWAIVASQNRSLRRAAEVLNIRQSTLSRRLRDLEEHLGVPLFERTSGGTRATIAGREFLSAARRILAETESAVRKLKMRSRGENGQLTIGIYASLSTGNMYATLVEHRLRFPEVEVHTVDGDHDQLLCALSNNTADVAIMTASRSGWGDRALPLWSERVIIAFHQRHSLSGKVRGAKPRARRCSMVDG